MDFSTQSRVWIYQSDRELSAEETAQIQQELNDFANLWSAHNQQLLAKGEVIYNRFLVLIVDERQAGASGCSIDKSVNFMKGIEKTFGINLFDRFHIAYRQDDAILSVNRDEFEDLLREGSVNEQTIVFNNLVQTLDELQSNWEVPMKDSWHARVFAL